MAAIVHTSEKTRNENDYYPTPQWMTQLLLERVPIGGTILEPFAGRDLAISELLRPLGTVFTNDIDEDAAVDTHLDLSLRFNIEQLPEVDWLVSNPPYGPIGNSQDWVLPVLYQKARVGMAMLLRQTWLNPGNGERGVWLPANPPRKIINFPRYKWTPSTDKQGKIRWATDGCQNIWVVWCKSDWQPQFCYEVVGKDQIRDFHDRPRLSLTA